VQEVLSLTEARGTRELLFFLGSRWAATYGSPYISGLRGRLGRFNIPPLLLGLLLLVPLYALTDKFIIETFVHPFRCSVQFFVYGLSFHLILLPESGVIVPLSPSLQCYLFVPSVPL